jgi:glycosyltransferase involved in cell wall biosynthesis
MKRYVVGYAGRFVKSKGIDLLIKAVAQLKNSEITILLIGNGPEKEAIKALSARYNLSESLKIIETVEYKEMPSCLSSMDILVLPSITTAKWKEQFGRVLIEAMACGTVVIGSRSGEIPNVVGDAGLLFDENNVEQLATHIQTILQSPETAERFRTAGLQRAREQFSWDAIADRMYKMFKELV